MVNQEVLQKLADARTVEEVNSVLDESGCSITMSGEKKPAKSAKPAFKDAASDAIKKSMKEIGDAYATK